MLVSAIGLGSLLLASVSGSQVGQATTIKAAFYSSFLYDSVVTVHELFYTRGAQANSAFQGFHPSGIGKWVPVAISTC